MLGPPKNSRVVVVSASPALMGRISCFPQITQGTSGLKGAEFTYILRLCATGLCSFGGQMSKTFSLQIAKTVGVLVVRYLDVSGATSGSGCLQPNALCMVGSCWS
jgi:hypothetical protein